MCVCVFVCSVSYPACNTEAAYCHLWAVIFFHLSHKRKYFRKNYLFFISSKTPLWKISHSKKNLVRCDKNVYWSLRKKQLLLLYDFNKTWIFFEFFEKKTQISNFIKIRPSVVQLFQSDRRTDGRTDKTKLTVIFRNFTNTRKNVVTIKTVWQNVVRDSKVSDFETLKSKGPWQ